MTNFFSLRKSIDLVELVRRAMIFFSISLRSAGKINAKNPSICSRPTALYSNEHRTRTAFHSGTSRQNQILYSDYALSTVDSYRLLTLFQAMMSIANSRALDPVLHI